MLIAASVASYFVLNGGTDGAIANIYQQGECVHSVDLSRVSESYTIQITGAVTNTIAVENGRISVLEASCPDQICVHQGWIANGVVPIVCLPNSLVIQIENAAESELDAITR